MFSLWFPASERSPNHPSTIAQLYSLAPICVCVECCGSADSLAPFDRTPSAFVAAHLVFVEFLVFIRNARKAGEKRLLPAVVPSLSAPKGELPASRQVPSAPNLGGIHTKSGVLTMFLGHGGENVNIVFRPVLTGGFLLGTFQKLKKKKKNGAAIQSA